MKAAAGTTGEGRAGLSRAGLARSSSLAAGPAALWVVAALAAGCTREQWHRFPSPDDLIARVPWFAAMHRGLAVQPYAQRMREPVPGTVPVTGGEIELRVENERDLPLINRMRNPAARTSESLNRGKELWGIYCFPCHGVEGRGDGPVAPKFVRPPDFAAPDTILMTDGYVYTTMRYGRGVMPAYGDKVRGLDRWHLVNYVMMLRNMQQRRPAEPLR